MKTADVISEQLTLVRGRRPDPTEIEAWLRDLSGQLGSIAPKRLAAAFQAARGEVQARKDAGRYGAFGLDWVISSYRKTPAQEEDLPVDPHCTYQCNGGGEQMMIDPHGYDVTVPCSCEAGEHLRKTRRIYQRKNKDGTLGAKRNVDELRRYGWRLAEPSVPLSLEDTAWLMARAEVGGIMAALREFRESPGGLPSLPPGSMDRARATLKIRDAEGR